MNPAVNPGPGVPESAPASSGFRLSELWKDRLFLLVILAPAMLILIFTIGIPIVKSIYMSFFDVTLLKMKSYSWNQFHNYQQILTDGEFFTSLRTTFVYVIGIVLIQFTSGLAARRYLE
ncbi:hypothetical protein [Paenibacillus hexagrammi]|uniref:Sugar ABC transporter permease n=1 Tax=Paenibacillus hexagrammi TaxID=2908839 RepID=A0ABY3SP43_9BACL|nr:hypothetical protein [Paenibacillus sp. YPD9-1]UJF35729.1 hypothetical protein L0M14_11925 [Paenibacillus sp. YPD9-1]